MTSLTEFNYLGIGKVVDLRGNSEIKKTSPVEKIRKAISITYYTNDKNVRKAVEQIIKGVVEQKTNVLFNCNIGRDRTGTIAYIIEGILGVSSTDRGTDYELTYFYSAERTRSYGSFKTLISKFNYYSKDKYEQERFINWYLSTSSNKEKDLKLINDFRKIMIDGNPHIYKLVSGKLTLA
jgi:protein tyrosine/serine phosphatase